MKAVLFLCRKPAQKVKKSVTCSFFRIYDFMITIFIYKEKMLEDKSDGKFPKDKILP